MNEKKSSIIWNKYQSIWQELYQEYIYAFKNYQEYSLFVKKCLNQDNVKDKENIDYYKEIIKKNIHNDIKYRLYNKKNNNLLLRYINSKLDKNNDSLKEMNKLIKWLKEYNYVPSPNTIIKLIENSEVFKELIQKLVENNLTKIKQYGIEKIFNNELISLFAEIYCSLNNIDLGVFENDIETDILDDEQVAINDILREQNISTVYEEDNEKRNEVNDDYMPTGADAFLFEIRNKDLKVLTKEEERELLTKIKQGDQDAYKYFYEHNCRLVISIAKRYRSYRVDYEDLIQEGCIGLMIAIDRFELERNLKFSTYATWWIRQYVARALSKYGRNIGIGINKNGTLPQYQRKVDNYADELGRMPTDTEIAKHLDMPLSEVQENNQLLLPNISMNQRVNNVDETEFGDFIKDDSIELEDDFISENLTSEIQILFQKAGLLPIEIAILNSSWGLNNQNQVTLSELGKRYGFTRERARQYEAKAIKKLRRFSGMKDFALYLNNPKEGKENLAKLINWHCSHPDSHIVYDIDLSKVELEKEEKVVNERPIKKVQKENSLYSYFSQYKKKDIDAVLEKLTTEEKKILTIYEEYLKNPTINSLWNKPNIKIAYQNIITKITKSLAQKTSKKAKISTIYDFAFCKEYNKNEIKIAILMLNPEDQEIINLRYGSNLDNPVASEKWDFKKYGDIFYDVVIPHLIANLKLIHQQNEEIDVKINNLNNDDKLDRTIKYVYIKALNLIKLYSFRKIAQHFSSKETEILAILAIKQLENINVEIEDFMDILELNKEELSPYLKNILIFLNENQEILVNLKNNLYNKKTKMRRK